MKIDSYKLEICANSVASCIEAQKGGAYRVELCAGIPEGGTTPSYGDMVMARESLKECKLNVIIRPRGGDFLYSSLEHKIMLHDIEMARKTGVDGVVIGCLTAEGEIDMIRNRELMDAAGDLPVTFHRAFDMTRNPFESLEKIIELSCARILTSGQKPTAEEGIELIAQLVEKAGERIIIMPGSGVNLNNIEKLAVATCAQEFHMSGRKSILSDMKFRNPNVSMGGTNITIPEYERLITDDELVSKVVSKLSAMNKNQN